MDANVIEESEVATLSNPNDDRLNDPMNFKAAFKYSAAN